MIYKEKQFSCYLYDQMEDEQEALHPDNPRNFMDSLSPLISVIVSREAGTILYEDLADQFGSDYIDRMIRCGVLRREGQHVYLDTPVFLKSDASVLAEHFASAAGKIADLIVSCKQPLYELAGKINNGFSPERNLYHLLCGWSMDGAMIDRNSTSGISKWPYRYRFCGFPNGVSIPPRLAAMFCRMNRGAIWDSSCVTVSTI